ncbi:MAG: GtrA family protein [Lachnospiraceae bacterium]|nr:GtrA family protein [Lachnospiraceae bacterium]
MKKLIEQILKFGVVGVVSTIIDFAVFSFLNYVVGIHYMAATFFGFTISLIANYILSMKFVFERRENLDKRVEFIAFAVLSVIGLILNEIIIYGCVDGVYNNVAALQNMISRGTAEMAGKIIATGIVMVYNFVTRKLFLEKKPSK